jgi:hypothetical protein
MFSHDDHECIELLCLVDNNISHQVTSCSAIMEAMFVADGDDMGEGGME